MTIQYMLTARELTEIRVTTATGAGDDKTKRQGLRRRWMVWCLLSATVVVWTYVVVQHWCDMALIWDATLGRKSVVTGIMYDGEKPYAVILGRIVHEGDIVRGYQVKRIHPDRVELVRDGIKTTERIRAKIDWLGAALGTS